jgi:RNA polymerase sigma-70 factor (ECF subfamily)
MHGHDDPDARLMRQVAGGDRRAMHTLVRRFGSPLLTFIRRMTGDHHLAEELFQEVFLTVWLKRHQYKPPLPVRPWLFKIALNKCRAHWRRARPVFVSAVGAEGASPVDGHASADSGPFDTAVAVETAAIVEAAVLRLPTQQRAVVAMRVWEGMSYAQIAQAVERSENTVRSNMHHALKSLRVELAAKV